MKKIIEWLRLIWEQINKKANSGWAKVPGGIAGFGVDDCWYWMSDYDVERFGNALVKSGLTATSVGVFACANSPESVLCDGSWMDNFNAIKPKLTKFLDAMKARKIWVRVEFCGWQNINNCAAKFNDAWMNTLLDYLVARGPDGLMILIAAEPGSGKPADACIAKYYHWCDLMNAKWTGVKLSNDKGGSPWTAPAGYTIEFHANHIADKMPPGCIAVTDGPSNNDLVTGNEYGTKVTLPKARDTMAQFNAGGRGLILWGWPYIATNIDWDGIKGLKR